MGTDNTISILGNICTKLQTIIDKGSANPSVASERAQSDLINGRSTGVQSTQQPIASAKTTDTKVGSLSQEQASSVSIKNDISIKDITAFLSSLPLMVKTITGMKDKEIKQFSNVLDKLSSSIVSFVKNDDLSKISTESTKKYKEITDSIASLGSSVSKIAKQAPLMPLFLVSVNLLGPGISAMKRVFEKLDKFPDGKDITKSIDSMAKLMKGMGVVIGASIALALAFKVVGAKEVLGGIGATLGIITALSGIAIGISFVTGKMQGADRGMKEISNFILKMTLITGACFALGLLIKTQLGTVLAGLGGVLAVMTGFMVIAGVAGVLGAMLKMEFAFLAEIVKFAAFGLALTMGTMLIGALMEQGEGLVVKGLAGVLAIMIGFTAVSFAAAYVGALLDIESKAGVFNKIIWFAGWSLGLGFGVVLLGKFLDENEWATAKAFLLMTGILASTLGLAKLISIIDKDKTLERSLVGLKSISLFMLACAGTGLIIAATGKLMEHHELAAAAAFTLVASVVGGAVLLAKYIDKTVKYQTLHGASKGMFELSKFMTICGAVALEIAIVAKVMENTKAGAMIGAAALVSGVVLGAMGIAKFINSVYKPNQTTSAAKSLTQIGIFMAIAAGITFGITIIAKRLEQIKPGAVIGAMTLMSLVVLESAALAQLASKLGPSIKKGAIALLICEGLAAGATAVLGALVGISLKAKELGDNWGLQILGMLGILGLVVVEFGALAIAAAYATVPVLLGIPAMATIELFAFASVKLINGIADLQKKMNDYGLTKQNVLDTVDVIGTSVNAFVDLAKNISLGGPLGAVKLLAKSATMAMLMSQMGSITESLNKIAQVSSPDGKIRPMFVGKDGEVTYGDPVDLVSSATIIASTIETFTKTLSENLRKVKLLDMAKAIVVVKSMSTILDPITSFTNALTSFDSGDGTTLHTVKIDDNGNVVNGPDINVVNVANLIAAAVSTFARTLFSKENGELWSKIGEGNAFNALGIGKTPMERAMGILSTVISPVCTFVDTMAKFQDGGENELLIIEYDEKGNPKVTRTINVVSVSQKIADAITTFATVLTSKQSLWEDMFGTRKSRKGMGIFGDLIEPVVNFVDVMSKFTVNNGTLSIIDKDGKEHATDLRKIGETISSSITSFVTAISSISVDDTSIHTADTVTKIIQNTTDPVSQFVTAISKYDGCPPGTLPVFDNNGNVVSTVNVVGIANEISNTISSFSAVLAEMKTAMIDNTDELDAASSAISSYVKTLIKNIEDKTVNKMNKFSKSVGNTATNLKKFDDVLTKGDKKRVTSIKNLSTEIDNLGNKLSKVETKLGSLSTLFSSINNCDPGHVRELVDEISKLKLGRAGGGGGGKGTDPEDIRDAIIEAFGDAQLNISYEPSNGADDKGFKKITSITFTLPES